jgi:hypothetical protein
VANATNKRPAKGKTDAEGCGPRPILERRLPGPLMLCIS